jgi:uncharacterized protein (DUF433 family)
MMSYDEWCKLRVSRSDEVLGGSPVFAGTRLSVAHVGGLVGSGAVAEVRQDYPYLSDEDIEHARIFALAQETR